MDSSRKAITPPRDFIFGPLTGHALSLRRNRLGHMHSSLIHYGDFLIMYLGKTKTILVNDPKSVKHVLIDNFKNYPKSTPGYKKVADVIGWGVFTDVGEEWRIGRKVIQPIFNPHKYDYFFNLILDEASHSLKTLTPGEEINLSSLATRYALNVIGRSLINERLEKSFDVISTNLCQLINLTEKKMMFLTNIKTPAKNKILKDFDFYRKQMESEIIKIINHEKEKIALHPNSSQDNFVKILLSSKENFTEEKILSQVTTMIFAGHETSANALMWALYYLATFPQWQERLVGELNSNQYKLQDEDDLEKYKHLHLFLSEVLRLRPPVWSFGRVALAPDQIHGETVAPGDLISLSPFLIHHNPKYWDSPETFNPDRFSTPPIPYSYIPFGAGQRVCMGERLAQIELKIFLIKFLSEFTLKLTQDAQSIKMNPQVSLRMNKPLILKVLKRKNED